MNARKVAAAVVAAAAASAAALKLLLQDKDDDEQPIDVSKAASTPRWLLPALEAPGKHVTVVCGSEKLCDAAIRALEEMGAARKPCSTFVLPAERDNAEEQKARGKGKTVHLVPSCQERQEATVKGQIFHAPSSITAVPSDIPQTMGLMADDNFIDVKLWGALRERTSGAWLRVGDHEDVAVLALEVLGLCEQRLTYDGTAQDDQDEDEDADADADDDEDEEEEKVFVEARIRPDVLERVIGHLEPSDPLYQAMENRATLQYCHTVEGHIKEDLAELKRYEDRTLELWEAVKAKYNAGDLEKEDFQSAELILRQRERASATMSAEIRSRSRKIFDARVNAEQSLMKN